MKTILLTSAAVALMAMSPAPSPIGAAVTRVGGNSATTCYHAAVARDASGASFAECNSAISQDAIPFGDLVATYVNRGVLKLVRADYRGAEADFNQAMGLDIGQPEAWLNKGISRYQQGDFQSARQMFSRAIELKTSYAPLAYFGRALANEDSGDVRAAYEDYQRAAALDPSWDAPREQLTRFKVVRRTNA